MQALRIADLVILGFALRHQLECAHQRPPVVRVGGSAGGYLAQKVSRRDRVFVGSADSQRGFGSNAAWPHVADLAANAFRAELALRLLGSVTIPHSLHLGTAGDYNHFIGCRIG